MDIISPELIFVRGPNTLLSELYSSYKDYGLTILFNDPKKDENTLISPNTPPDITTKTRMAWEKRQ